jgi:hypothetical protein
VVGAVMSPSTPDSPCDPDDLRRLADDLRRDVAWLRAEVHAKALMIEKLRAELAVLRPGLRTRVKDGLRIGEGLNLWGFELEPS